MLRPSDKSLLQKMHKRYDAEFDSLIVQVKSYCRKFDESVFRKAYEIGLQAHLHQTRYSGEPYFGHCLSVAQILAEMRMDNDTIIAGLLHDTVEDTDITLDDIRNNFNETVSLLVDGVTKIGGLKFQSREARQAETFRKMLLSMAQDIRVIIIKFADRLHNMRTLEHVPKNKRPRIARETRDVYAPLAHRLGIAHIKTELEDLSLKILEEKEYYDIDQKISESQEKRDIYIEQVTKPILRELRKHKIKSRVFGRSKSYFSIFNKMKIRNRPFEEIYDLLAIRIIVDKLEECYYVLGIVHALYMPVYDRFKDYIAMPKVNGYQSLHTTVIGPKGRMVEIQIRTNEMHKMAEDGIAAHWKYKEGVSGTTSSQFEKHLNWVKDLLENQMQEKDPGDFMESLIVDLYQDEVFVFTPAGDLIKLPRNSTPIDFAYAVHTNVGNHCIAAKVNGRIVALRTQLKSGQQVEIITSDSQKPNQDWLAVVKTSKARHWIKRFLREEQKEQTLQIGDEILTKYLSKFKIKPEDEAILKLLPDFGFQNIESLKVAIGRGEFVVEQITKKLFPEEIKEPPKDKNFFANFLKKARSGSGIKVHGIENMLLHFAKCCQPVPGDRIVGYLTKGKGLTIHRTDCKNMLKLYEEKERIVDVDWDVDQQDRYQVHLSVLGEDRQNLLKDITLNISKQDINIINVHFWVEDMYARGSIDIAVKNLQHLTKIIKSIGKVAGVIKVERVQDVS